MGMQSKDLRKVCGELKAAKLIFSHSKSEIKEGSNRTTSRDYYYIPFHHVIDGIKWRIYKLTSTIKSRIVPSSEKKALHCANCDASYTELEAMSYFSDEGYTCERCGHLLENEDASKVADTVGFETQNRLMSEIEKLLTLLKQIDQVDIPANEFDDAWNVKVEIKRPEATERAKFPGQTSTAAVRGAVGSTDAANLSISISTSAELTAAQEAEEAKRKAEFLAKNAAPDWFKTSAVSGAITGQIGDSDTRSQSNGASTTIAAGTKRKAENDEARRAAETAAMDDELKAYYAAMAREKEQEAKESASSSDEEEDEEDGFEDVNVSTPNVKANGIGIARSNVKDESESMTSSAPPTSTATPADSTMDSRPVKRVKAQEKTEESDEDDEEFEDVGKASKPATSTAPGSRIGSGIGIGTSNNKKKEDEDSDEDDADFEDV
jgi:transcription initiation factor TFIIE subunit alpha